MSTSSGMKFDPGIAKVNPGSTPTDQVALNASRHEAAPWAEGWLPSAFWMNSCTTRTPRAVHEEEIAPGNPADSALQAPHHPATSERKIALMPSEPSGSARSPSVIVPRSLPPSTYPG